MDKAEKIVNSAILGLDFETVVVNGRAYIIKPLTIHKIAGLGYYLSDMKKANTVLEMIKSLKDIGCIAKALSFIIQGDESLSEELSRAPFDEVVDALSVGMSMISAENFYKLSVLAKNVALLTAKPK